MMTRNEESYRLDQASGGVHNSKVNLDSAIWQIDQLETTEENIELLERVTELQNQLAELERDLDEEVRLAEAEENEEQG